MVPRHARPHAHDFSALFKAISDETRIKILKHLEERPTRVSDLVQKFNFSQSTISRHLGILKAAGLVVGERKGKEVHYTLNPNVMIGCCCDFFGSFSCCKPLLGGRGKRARRGRKKT
ncbi:MAG: winged helix-turn-helix transcriptional regulator [Candidatus Eiseniibacteriota bacterium]|nr:MAG: winged helix-turn-helix transcriptional regulator [Candidatus Eisenbacteria bacterium]